MNIIINQCVFTELPVFLEDMHLKLAFSASQKNEGSPR